MGQNKQHTGIAEVSKDIIEMKFKDDDTLSDVHRRFYDIMRKHGIKYGAKSGNGVIGANFEWTMCYTLFVDQICHHFEWENMMGNIPDDILC